MIRTTSGIWVPDESLKVSMQFFGIFTAQCFDPDGKLKWEDWGQNIVVNEGLQHILDVIFNGNDSANANIDPWYVGLVDGTISSTTYAAGDTLASHAGWTENTAYTGNRKDYVGVRASQTMSNTASKASFAIDTDSQTIGGAFMAEVNTGSAGVLLCEADFTGGEKAADNGDTLEVTYTVTASSS
jgi:hypothetical protein